MTVAILTSYVASRGPVPFRGAEITRGPAFWHWIRIGRKFGLRLVIARRQDWDGRHRRLRAAFWHDGHAWCRLRSVAFDAILPRVPLGVRRSPVPVVYWNHPAVWKICADKWRTYRAFRSVSPETWLVRSARAVQAIRRKYPDQAFVLKPRRGTHARGVVFLPPGRQLPGRLIRPTLLQRAIDGGAFLRKPGIWDIRCYVQNGQVDLAVLKRGTVRQPILDASRGTPMVRWPVSRLPFSARQFIHAIDRRFRRSVPRHYAVDFRYDLQGRPRLIELNHLPVFHWGTGSDYPRFYRRLCRIVIDDFRRTNKGSPARI